MACPKCSKSSNDICDVAAKNGHLKCLKWARRNGYRWDEETCAFAAKYGHLDCLMWARCSQNAKEACPWDEWTCSWAAKEGHLKCLKWARRNGCPWDEDTCAYAAKYGHLDCLIWARKHGCPWDEKTCAYAAYHGHLDCLIWARCSHSADIRCPWNKRACYWALRNGHMDVRKWIHRNGSSCDCMKIVYIYWDGWEKEDEDCAICLEKLDESTVKFVKCVHHYHKECMDMMFKTREKKGCSICERT